MEVKKRIQMMVQRRERLNGELVRSAWITRFDSFIGCLSANLEMTYLVTLKADCDVRFESHW